MADHHFNQTFNKILFVVNILIALMRVLARRLDYRNSRNAETESLLNVNCC